MKKIFIISFLISFILLILLFVISLIFVATGNGDVTAPLWFVVTLLSVLCYLFLHIPLGLIAWFKEIKEMINEMTL